MTPEELVAQLRSRINPAFAEHIGTESYERRICAEALEALLEENAQLRDFAQEIIAAWIDGSGLDGGDIQGIGKKHGLLKREVRYEPCNEACYCTEFTSEDEWASGAVCFRKTSLLTGG